MHSLIFASLFSPLFISYPLSHAPQPLHFLDTLTLPFSYYRARLRTQPAVPQTSASYPVSYLMNWLFFAWTDCFLHELFFTWTDCFSHELTVFYMNWLFFTWTDCFLHELFFTWTDCFLHELTVFYMNWLFFTWTDCFLPELTVT